MSSYTLFCILSLKQGPPHTMVEFGIDYGVWRWSFFMFLFLLSPRWKVICVSQENFFQSSSAWKVIHIKYLCTFAIYFSSIKHLEAASEEKYLLLYPISNAYPRILWKGQESKQPKWIGIELSATLMMFSKWISEYKKMYLYLQFLSLLSFLPSWAAFQGIWLLHLPSHMTEWQINGRKHWK